MLRSLEYPAGRRRDQDIEQGHPQRSFDKHASGRVGTSSPHEHAAEAFAHDLADELRRGRLEHGVERIVLVAEPHFLGLVRAKLDEPTERLVVGTLPKDLVDSELEALREQLDDVRAF